MKFKNVREVQIDEERWRVRITITENDGTVTKLVASADSYFTEYDHIWFGTEQEHEDFIE